MSMVTGCLGSMPGSLSRKRPVAFIASSLARNCSAESASFITTRRTTAPAGTGTAPAAAAGAWALAGTVVPSMFTTTQAAVAICFSFFGAITLALVCLHHYCVRKAPPGFGTYRNAVVAIPRLRAANCDNTNSCHNWLGGVRRNEAPAAPPPFYPPSVLQECRKCGVIARSGLRADGRGRIRRARCAVFSPLHRSCGGYPLADGGRGPVSRGGFPIGPGVRL